MNAGPSDPLVLTFIYGFHMLATVAWVGGLAAFALIILPAANKGLPAGAYDTFFARMSTRLQRIGWFSLVVLIITGLFQMSAHPQYEGVLAVNNTWSIAIFAKHIVIGGMVAISAYVTWIINPAYQRLSLMKSKGALIDDSQLKRLQRREVLALRLMLAIAVVVLLLTALARVS
jgi:uncharacterized membrane protein